MGGGQWGGEQCRRVSSQPQSPPLLPEKRQRQLRAFETLALVTHSCGAQTVPQSPADTHCHTQQTVSRRCRARPLALGRT